MLNHLHLKTFREGVYDALKRSILHCELSPGQRLVEKELVARIGTSRTPIREAIIKLEQEGLVEKLDGRGGYFVSSIQKRDVEEVFGIREVLEKYCLDLVIDRIRPEELEQMEEVLQEEQRLAHREEIAALVELDTKFHEIIYRASGNQKLYHIMDQLKNQIYRYRMMSFQLRERTTNHRELFLAIHAKDKKSARRLIHETMLRSKTILLQEVLGQDGPVRGGPAAG